MTGGENGKPATTVSLRNKGVAVEYKSNASVLVRPNIFISEVANPHSGNYNLKTKMV
jgi:hypothetical protein